MVKNYDEFTRKMDKSINYLKDELASIRAGRANPRLLDKISVDYYGTPTPVNQLANIQVPEARQIVIQLGMPKYLMILSKLFICQISG